MPNNVSVAAGLVFEAGTADVTRERLFSLVRQHVSVEVVLAREGGTADVAGERFV